MSLDDITIVDCTRVRAGPWCTQILSELGAEVIKIERPGVGDSARGSYPEQNGMGVNYISRNRNKKSVTLNLKDERGQEIAKELIADADILVENFSLGVMEKFGLGAEHLISEVNPNLIYASIKGYGEKGPQKDQKGVDLVMQAEAGIMSVTGQEDGDPVKVGQAIGDIGAGLYATIAILTALHHRDKTGEGQKVETNLFGTIVSFMEEYITMYGITGENPTPKGTRHQTSVPYQLFETKDGHVVISTLSMPWDEFVTEILELPDHPISEYDTVELRQNHYDEIMTAMEPKIKERTTKEWLEISNEYGFPCGPLNKVSDVVSHPQAREREYVFEYEDENVGNVLLHGHPLHFSKLKKEVRSGPPRLGQHTDEVLSKVVGLSEGEIDDLRNDGAI
ncbi:CaiB/BaiF CoA transferase family protein [Natronorarus salvus]|uniref:CaiB/BaiF CoA transferase family protein n=1 Tax=Natronorarus salvus TaxID=3117733 RepID=UPI002F265570